MIRQIKDIYEKRQLIWTLAKADFKKRFIGSYMGIFWVFMQPVVSIIIYYFVFQIGFKSNPVEDLPYVLWLMPGVIPWFFFESSAFAYYPCNFHICLTGCIFAVWGKAFFMVDTVFLLFVL